MKYKVGDKVKIKSLEWYNQMRDSDGDIYLNDFGISFVKDMSVFCGKKATIVFDLGGEYQLDIDNKKWSWKDWMLEDEPTISEQLKEKRFHAACCAMSGILSTEYYKPIPNDKIVQMSYMLADELLKQGGFTE